MRGPSPEACKHKLQRESCPQEGPGPEVWEFLSLDPQWWGEGISRYPLFTLWCPGLYHFAGWMSHHRRCEQSFTHTRTHADFHTPTHPHKYTRKGTDVSPASGPDRTDTGAHVLSYMCTGTHTHTRINTQPFRSRCGEFTKQGCPPASPRELGRQQPAPQAPQRRARGRAATPPCRVVQVAFPSGPLPARVPGQACSQRWQEAYSAPCAPLPRPFLLLGPGLRHRLPRSSLHRSSPAQATRKPTARPTEAWGRGEGVRDHSRSEGPIAETATASDLRPRGEHLNLTDVS